MDLFEKYINCYLDSISIFNKTEYQKEFPWINDKLLKEEIDFWLSNGFLKSSNIVNKSSNKKFILFLDVDGVLNHSKSNEAIDDECLNNLSLLVKKTDAIIILVSSWKSGWNKNKEMQFDDDANYLDEKLKSFGISIFDKSSRHAFLRSFEVGDWLAKFNTNKYLILDDDISNYSDSSLMNHLVPCDYYNGGFNKDLLNYAFELLKKLGLTF